MFSSTSKRIIPISLSGPLPALLGGGFGLDTVYCPAVFSNMGVQFRTDFVQLIPTTAAVAFQ